MPTTYDEAYDVLTNTLIAGVVGMGALAKLPADPALRFDDVEKSDIPKDAFLRFTMNPVLERQATFRNPEGKQLYDSQGVFIIQCFVPRKLKTCAENLRLLSTRVKLLYRGNQLDGCVWARNVRVNKLDPEDNFVRANVVAEYEFEEVG